MVGIIAGLLFFQAAAAGSHHATIKGVEVSYPSSLTLEQGALLTDTRLTLTNFRGQWLHGGFIPTNGVEITIVRYEKKNKTLEEVLEEDSKGDKIVSRQAYDVDHQPGIRIVRETDYQIFKETTIIVYVGRREAIYKFFLNWDENSGRQKTFEALFDGVLAATKFR